MGTILELPPGVSGKAEGIFFAKFLFKFVSTPRETKRGKKGINNEQRRGGVERKRQIHYSSQIPKISFLWIATT